MFINSKFLDNIKYFQNYYIIKFKLLVIFIIN